MSGFFADGVWWDVTPDQFGQIKSGAETLQRAGIANATAEAQRLFVKAQQEPDAPFADLVARRAAHVPMAQLLGRRAFYKHDFQVTADVLDPRPETEVLVIAALAAPFSKVLDLGTGSGCILLSLLAERSGATGQGVDISAAALQVARANAVALGVEDRVTLAQSDWFAAVEGVFDLIVSNPPYIAAAEMADLTPDVREHEPRVALTDEGDGLECYRNIIAKARDYLTQNGRLLLEIGPTQADAVTALLSDQGFAQIAVMRDLDGRNRVVSAVNTSK